MASPDTRPSNESVDSIRRALRSAGLRVTKPRTEALNWLARHPHSSVDEINAAVRQRLGSVSRQAIYDLLAACRRAGLVRCIEPAGHPARYECRVGDNHHHMVCRECGHIEDVDCIRGACPCLTPDTDSGFTVDEAEVVFWGDCSRCRAGSSEAIQSA